MKTIKDKTFRKRFWIFFEIEIYSDDRYADADPIHYNTLYKHFVYIYFLNFVIFNTYWRTGTYISGTTDDGGFYIGD